MNRASKKRVSRALSMVAIFLFTLAIGYVLWLFYVNETAERETTPPGVVSVITPTSSPETTPPIVTKQIEIPEPTKLFPFIVIKNSCDAHYVGECVRVRSGPGLSYPVVTRLRNGVLLMVSTTTVEGDTHTWYHITFDEVLKYPERVVGEWWVASDYADTFENEGNRTIWENEHASTSKYIIIDRSEQKLYAYDSDTLFMETSISTGLELSPTPRGTFSVFKMTPTRYMQGPLPGYTDVYDLPGVPWNLYFTDEGAVIHGAYWHTSFGSRYSHGCVNLLPTDAEKLYAWAELGMKVTVRD